MRRIVSAPTCIAVDTSIAVNAAQARALAASKWGGKLILGVAQYLPLHANKPGSGDITASGLQGILAAGMGCWPVQHVLMPGWVASAQLGSDLGGAAGEYAFKVGYLPGINIGVDQEGCKSIGDPVIEFLEAWAKEVTNQGYGAWKTDTESGFGFQPMPYQGFANGLTGSQWYTRLPDIHRYWSDYGQGRKVDVRGFAIVQHPQTRLPGLSFDVDPDTVAPDALGGCLQWMVDDAYYVDPSERPTEPLPPDSSP